MGLQDEIIRELGVATAFDAEQEIHRRVEFLSDYARSSGARALVLGISGGVDSLTAGLLAQRAVEALRKSGHDAHFIAVRLPYGSQADEADA